MAEPVFKSVEVDEDATNSAGRSLRYEREKQGLSIEDVAQQLRLSAEIIRDLEAGNVDVLPGVVYIRGYVRAYCKLLKIDPEPLLADIVLESVEHEEDDSLPAMNEQAHRLTRLWGSFAVFSVIVLLVSAWWLERPRGMGELPTAPGSILEPAPEAMQEFAPPPPVEEVPDEQPASESPFITDGELAKITIYATGRSWARLTDGSGEVIINGMLSPDYRATVYGVFPFDFKFGDARSVRVWVDDVEYSLEKHISVLNTAFFMLEKPFE